MELDKIGMYIAGKRKALGMTQVQLAEKLGMSDKSVSKWERGVCFPDVSVYMELCNILGISLNEFIAGEDIGEDSIGKKSEENLIAVTKDGDSRRKRLKWIIAALIIVTMVAISSAVYVMYINQTPKRNFIEPVDRESPEMKMAQTLSKTDGAYLYNYSVDGFSNEMIIYLSVYENGILVRKEDLASISYVRRTDGLIAVIPDFEEFKINLIIAGEGTKFSTDFDILEGVENREYYGRSATEIADKIDITANEEQGLICFIYDNDILSAYPIDSIEHSDFGTGNDFMYYLSVSFGTVD